MSEERNGAAPGNQGAAPNTEDLRATIASALAASRDDEAHQEAQAAPPEPADDARREGEGVDPGAADAASAGAGEARERSRGETGEADGTDGADAGGDRRAKQPEAGRAAEKPAERADGASPPQHWSQQDREEFSRIANAEQAREWSLKHYKRMEAGFAPKLQKGAQLERDYGDLDRTIFTPDQRQIIQRNGANVAQVVTNWANIERTLDRGLDGNEPTQAAARQEQRDQLLARMIFAYGGQPARIAALLQGFHEFQRAQPQQQPQAQPAQPVYGAGHDGYGANGAYGGVDPAVQSRLTALEAHHYEAARRDVEAFGQAKDANGELLHPHFEEVRAKMAEMARSQEGASQFPDLEKLYRDAVWTTDSTREVLLSQRDADKERKAAEERKARADNARRAGSSINGSPSPGQAPQNLVERSLRDEIRANLSSYRH